MFKFLALALFTVFFVLSLSALVFSQAATEELVITTYYPSPNGSYLELRAKRMAIGDTYYDTAQYCWSGSCTTTINANADLVVEGNVGIGTTSPTSRLDLGGLYDR